MNNIKDWRIGSCAGYTVNDSLIIRAYCGMGDCCRCSDNLIAVCPFMDTDKYPEAECACGWEDANAKIAAALGV